MASVQRTYTIVFTPDHESGGFLVACPALPSLVTHGETLERAREMAKDAIEGYLAVLRDQGENIPAGEPPILEEVTVSVAAE